MASSRDTVEGALPSPAAIDRSDFPPATPREISSRSSNDNRNGDRGGVGLASRSNRLILRRIAHRDRSSSRCNNQAGARTSSSFLSCTVSLSDHPSTTHLPIRSNTTDGADAMTP
jgi:hypothetical protein